MTIELKISLLSAAASLISVFLAWTSYRVAKRALLLSEKEADSKTENVEPYLISSIRWSEGEEHFVSFACRYINCATAPNTLSKINLTVYAFDMEGRKEEMSLPSIAKEPNDSSFSLLAVPLNLEPRATVSGWLTFKLPATAFEDLVIDRYEIAATSWSGKRINLESYLVMTEQQHEG